MSRSLAYCASRNVFLLKNIAGTLINVIIGALPMALIADIPSAHSAIASLNTRAIPTHRAVLDVRSCTLSRSLASCASRNVFLLKNVTGTLLKFMIGALDLAPIMDIASAHPAIAILIISVIPTYLAILDVSHMPKR
mmetsp:Transcript_55381/g.96814  ORF Transcript_55381/g.96814 Transcript_55381/m.96814 type:complete len:137 (+) Transcript_55381:177-587(+)